MNKPALRKLHLGSFDEVRNELDRLLTQGYKPQGKWDLSQIALHLRDFMNYPIDGFPKVPWFLVPIMYLIRKLRKNQLLNEFVHTQTMPTGLLTVPQSVHRPSDETVAVEELKRSIERLENFNGPFQPSPAFGSLSKDKIVALELAHCAHHLRFLS